MKLGVHYIDFLPGDATQLQPTLAATATAAEDAGFALFTLADHFFQMENIGNAADPFLECYTTLGYLAGITERMSLSTLVTGVTYRHPGVLAKTMTTLDVLSQGRSLFGLGAAWYDREHRGLGIPYPSLSERFEMLEETLQICLQMWSDDNGPFEGKHFQLDETCAPRHRCGARRSSSAVPVSVKRFGSSRSTPTCGTARHRSKRCPTNSRCCAATATALAAIPPRFS